MDDNERAAVFAEYPGAEPFSDMLIADDVDELREIARLVDGRVRAAAQNRNAPVGEPTAEEAVKARDFPAYLAAKRRQAEQE